MHTKHYDSTYIAPTYLRNDVALASGKGSELFDEDGKRYIDLGGGIAVNTFGAADEAWADAVSAQARKLQHTSNLYYTAPQAQLAKLLCERTGMKRVFFSNSGAEANECALKAARKYANEKYGGKRPNIVTLVNSFHGRTLMTLCATGQEAMHKHFEPFVPGFIHVPPNDIQAMEQALMLDDVAAVMMEPILGEGGVLVLDKAYVQAVCELVRKKDILLILDEVQTGNGRTGSLYAYMQYGIKPDILTTAKGLAGGLPIGATLFGEATMDVLEPGSHGSTFGGNPVCAAAALCTLKRIDGALMAGVKAREAYIRGELEGAPGVIGVSGLGLMLGIETCGCAKDILLSCMQRGVLVLSAKAKLRLLPPLNISMEQLAEAINILKEELAAAL